MDAEMTHHVELLSESPRATCESAREIATVLVLGGDVLLQISVHRKRLPAPRMRTRVGASHPRAAATLRGRESR